ncbi:MAG: hypothetical protein HY821_25600 [Acidobacteria bacterium]|nr:hypothetical protein [Acidobacteriota bacterium]
MEPEPAEPAPLHAAPEPVVPLESPVLPVEDRIGFGNGAAVRVGFLAAAVVQMVSTLSAAAGASLLLPLVLLAGGFYAVVLYSRRTGFQVSVQNGARMGWMTGIFSFVIMTVFFTAGIAMLAGSNELMKAYKESAASLGLPAEAAAQFEKLAADPAAFATSIVLGLVFQFVFLTLLCSMGGALAAKLRARKG